MNNFPNVQMYTRAFQVEENVGNERLEEDAKFSLKLTLLYNFIAAHTQ